MKKKLGSIFAAFALSAVLCLGAACGEITPTPTPEPNPGGTTDDTTYTITFTDRGEVVKTYTAKQGEKVAVPTAPDRGERYTFTGWEGLAEDATEVTVYASDATYDATWYEIFGSKSTFVAMQRDPITRVTVDGKDDESAWDAAATLALDENGSYAKLLWDEDAIYVFADVKKENATAEDSLSVTLDLLHSEKLASDSWDGIGWGGGYRGEPGPMVEGGYTIAAGTTSADAVVRTWEWLSNSGYSGSNVYSVLSATGYTVEFKIATTDSNIGDYKPHAGQNIGLGIKTSDGASALESFEDYANHGPKSLSNVTLAPNEGATVKTAWGITEIRENYDVKVDGEEDNVYKDATSFGDLETDGYTVKSLWTNGKIYLFAKLAEGTNSLGISAFEQTVTFTASGEQVLEASDIALEEISYFTVKVNGTLTVGTDDNIGLVTLNINNMNLGRKLYEAKRLAENATITVDGDLDSAYGEKLGDISVVTATENGGTPEATGEFYIRWDDEYLYVFVNVFDKDVSTEQRGEPYNNDSVEFWLDTCQQWQGGQGWGDDNRPVGLYRGEGGFRVVAGKVGADSGQHWLWDDDRTKPTTASKVTDNGYTVEYKIPWGKKFEEWDDGFANYIPALDAHVGDDNYTKVGQIIDFMININDDNGQDGAREGIVSLNAKGSDAWSSPWVLTQLKLVAAD